jgi:FMN phosphatase YigB (HAD superfamily)
MDQNLFFKAYFGGLAKKLAPLGFDGEALFRSIWKGTGAMIRNDGSVPNETRFWDSMHEDYGNAIDEALPYFEDFYAHEFELVQKVCGFDPRAAETVRTLKERGYTVALATQPAFPAVATRSRIRWAGLTPEDFELYTTYENSRFCKPNPAYYRDILTQMNLNPEECLMVGNDVTEDMIAQELGMQVFLLTDCMINKNNEDISAYPHGGFPELLEYIRSL